MREVSWWSTGWNSIDYRDVPFVTKSVPCIIYKHDTGTLFVTEGTSPQEERGIGCFKETIVEI